MPSELRLHDTTNPPDPKNTPDALQASGLSAYNSCREGLIQNPLHPLSIEILSFLSFRPCISERVGRWTSSIGRGDDESHLHEGGYIICYKIPRSPCKVLRNSRTMNHHELLYNLKANEMYEALPIRREPTAFPKQTRRCPLLFLWDLRKKGVSAGVSLWVTFLNAYKIFAF